MFTLLSLYTLPYHTARANHMHTLILKEVICCLIHFVQPPENTLCFNRLASFCRLITAPPFSRSCDIFIYLELACHDEQNSSQTFKIGTRITELWQFKAQKVEKLKEEDRLAIFKPGLWRAGFFGCSEQWYHFQQELMVSKMMIKLFS